MFLRPHRRYNPLTGEWIVVSPHRTQRPWQGREEDTPPQERPRYDAKCYLCPGNGRAGGKQNPNYTSTFVFDNDFPALLSDAPCEDCDTKSLMVARSERGMCRVVCFSPRHDLTLPEMDVSTIRQVVDAWADQYDELGQISWINHVQIFENKGAMMGCSNPHPHGQIWATETIPGEPAKELTASANYLQEKGSCLLCDYLALELESEERLVCTNDHFVVVVPFWAMWPFELLLLSRRHLSAFTDLTSKERDSLADILKRLTTRYDNLFKTAFPYSMGFHQRPTDGGSYPELHFHAHFYPPLLRSATVRKFMVGYEMLGEPQRDITAESAAERLRQLSEVHYKQT
jgi:UDPglucose--hexose-1-phosphate uridylyltransferase